MLVDLFQLILFFGFLSLLITINSQYASGNLRGLVALTRVLLVIVTLLVATTIWEC